MKLNDVIKPKSKEEIEDLERRGFRRDGGKWKFRIDISPLVKEYDEYEDTTKYKKDLIKLLESKIDDINILVGDESLAKYKTIIDKFKEVPKKPKPEELDVVMEILYDWTDNNNVFIESV